MIHDMIAIIQDYWLLLLIGQYPNGPLGGLANTLILSALSIALAFPVSILMALARLSKWRALRWPVTAVVYFTRGVPLLMLILWSYFLVPLWTGADVPSFVTMLTTLGTPLDVTAEELRIETYFPADDATERILRGWVS